MNTERVLIGIGDLVNFNADKFGEEGDGEEIGFRIKNCKN